MFFKVTSAKGTTKLCRLKIVQNTDLKMNNLYNFQIRNTNPYQSHGNVLTVLHIETQKTDWNLYAEQMLNLFEKKIVCV